MPKKPTIVVRKASSAFVRDVNWTAVLRLIGRDGPIARAEIARRLGLSPATLTSIARDLIARGLVRVVDQAPSRVGRPALLLGLVASAANALGVKIAADHLVGVRMNLDGEVLERFAEAFDAAAADVIERLAEVLRPYVAASGAAAPLLLGIGLGVPGVVDRDRHGTVDAPMLGWRGLPIGEELERALGVPVLIENDVNTLVVDERLYGRGQELEHFVTVTIGRGVGLGIVVGGELYRGARGGAGEFGHVPVTDDGPLCECGKYGCLEALVSDPALCEQARAEGLLGPGEGSDRLRELAQESEVPRRLYRRAGEILGRSVAGLVNILSPQLVLISGEGTQAWPYLAEGFEAGLQGAVFGPLRDVPVEIDPWDDAKWACGAAALVLRATFVPALGGSEPDESVRARMSVPEQEAEGVA